MLNPEIDVLEEFKTYRFRPADYMRERLGFDPWESPNEGVDDQMSIINGYTLALKQLHERRDYENGRLSIDELTVWKPGQIIQNYISIDAGHTVGKTAVIAGLSSHFFDTCAPSIIYSYAPTLEQINDLLWKEIRDQRGGRGLPGTVLKIPRLNFRANHFMVGKATNNAKGTGTERTQGQHNLYMMFVVDEAEGVPDFIWNAIKSMASGGIAIVLVARNPRTRYSEAHRLRSKPYVQTYRIDCTNHPNVVFGRPIYDGMVERHYVDGMINDHCLLIDKHDPEKFTFEVDWRDGIYEPEIEYLWRVMGRPGGSQTENTICSYAVYEKSQTREPATVDPSIAWIGIDGARYGDDHGTLYLRHGGIIRRVRKFTKLDGYEYYLAAKKLCLELDDLGVTQIYIRADAGGGYTSTAVDNLNRDLTLQKRFDVFQVQEISFARKEPYDDQMFGDFITELYWYAGQILKSYRLENPPNELELDLTERTFKYMRRYARDGQFYDVKVLSYNKEAFRNKFGRSPDDGDGFALACAPPFLVLPPTQTYLKTSRIETALSRRL